MKKSHTKLSPFNESKQVRELIGGDFNAFDSIFKHYHKKLYHFALSLLKSEQDAEDVIQDVFVKVWEKRRSINERQSFKSFIFTITYNIIVNHLKKRMTDVKFRKKLEKIAETDLPNEVDHLVTKEQENKYTKLLNQLSPQRKRIFKMHRELGMTYREIARDLNLSPNTVRNHFAIAMKILKEQT